MNPTSGYDVVGTPSVSSAGWTPHPVRRRRRRGRDQCRRRHADRHPVRRGTGGAGHHQLRGTVELSATDDGVNATSGSVNGGTEATEEGVLLTISGGTVLADDDGVVTSFVLRAGRSSFAVLADGITAGEDYTVVTVVAGAGGSADSTDGLAEIATATATEASDIATGGFGGR